MSIKETAFDFFDACETGKGWEVCKQWCEPHATFRAQCDALDGVSTLEDYTNWMHGIAQTMPNAGYEIISFGIDDERGSVCAAATVRGTHTAEGGPVPPTGKSTASDYCYVIEFDGDRISHMVKVWNDGYALRELGWA